MARWVVYTEDMQTVEVVAETVDVRSEALGGFIEFRHTNGDTALLVRAEKILWVSRFDETA